MVYFCRRDWKSIKLDLSGEFEVGFHFFGAYFPKLELGRYKCWWILVSLYKPYLYRRR